jgi:pimeloyl-ACP methyl ester carboxylesterase
MTIPAPSEEFPLTVDHEAGGIPLKLRRFEPATGTRPRGPVLLLHGGNSAGDTFLLPNGGLTAFLQRDGFDVWILDWRTSPRVVNPYIEKHPPLGGSFEAERRLFGLDHAAKVDIPEAVAEIRRHVSDRKLGIVGHCMGGGATSIAIAAGKLTSLGVTKVVLSTLGLFYEVPWNGWMKAEDFIVERIPHQDPSCRGIDPRAPERWPRAMTEAYGYWPPAWLPPGKSRAERMLQRLTFMFGQPYDARRLDPSIGEPELLNQFGAMHVGLFLHAAELVRRGYAAVFGAPDVLDRPRLGHGGTGQPVTGHYLLPQHFHEHDITLLCANDNQLWHRDAVDLMQEWLRSNGVESEKLTFPGYRIQELFWGARAEREVYPGIRDALR